ncbi:uncharacterized protein [Typha angustifolia]|uniref:uncharacterized protein n=1 Tax=Typha angustifolia TaxID=59011 RepID=UPI003C2B3E10
MARNIRRCHRLSTHKHMSTPNTIPSSGSRLSQKEGNPKNELLALEERDWKCANCPVCLEFPHNAVLLLCSSHDNGCRPYMCATGSRYSNCLDQYKKAYSNISSSPHEFMVKNWSYSCPLWNKSEVMELKCPLCRGQVKGWTVVEPARAYLNKKRRNCLQDNCLFKGTYKQLRKHVRAQHPFARARMLDPAHERKWKALEHQREREDVISAIRSSTPRAMVMGDYVIERDNSDSDSDFYDDDNAGSFRRVNTGTSRRFFYQILQEVFRRGRLNRRRGAPERRAGNDSHA